MQNEYAFINFHFSPTFIDCHNVLVYVSFFKPSINSNEFKRIINMKFGKVDIFIMTKMTLQINNGCNIANNIS